MVLSRFSPYLSVYCIFRCYILLLRDFSLPLYPFISGLHLPFSSSDQVNICLGLLLSSSITYVHTILRCYYPSLSELFVLLSFFLLITSFLTLTVRTLKMVVLRHMGTLWRNKFIWCEQAKIFLPFIHLAVMMWFPRNLTVNMGYYCQGV
jgi:hypothetical protein